MSRLDEINREIGRVRDLPYGTAHSSAAESVLRTVEAEGLDAARAFALFTLVDAYVFGEEGEKAYLPFTKMVRWNDEHPEHFDDYDRHSLFWAFKWMVADLADFPGVPASQISATLEDMARRYAIAGIGPSAVALVRYKWMRERHGAGATAAYDEWVTAPRDEFSDCEACTPGERASFLFECGRTDEGIRLLERTLADDPHCGTEPADMLSELALAYLDVGRYSDAVVAHRRAIQALADAQSSMAAARGRHVELLGRAGHPERAARRLEGDQRLLTTQESPRTRWAFLRGVLAGLSAAAILDPEQQVRLGTGPTTVAALQRDVDAEATAIAAALDARNGTDRYARLTAAARAATPVDPPVVIELAAAPSGPVTSPVMGGPGGGAEQAIDPAGALRLVRDSAQSLAAAGSFAEAGALWAQLSAGYQDAGMLEDAGLMAANLARCSAALGDPVGASRAFARATALLLAAGVDELVVIPVLTARAPIAAQAGDSAGVITDLETVIGAVEQRIASIEADRTGAAQTHPDGRDAAAHVAGAALTDRTEVALRHARLIARDTVARLLPDVGRSDDAVVIAQADAEEFLAEGAISSAAASLLLAAKVHVANGRPDKALWFAESAVEGYTLSRDRRGHVDAATVLIEVLRATGDEARAAEVAQTLVD